MNGANLNGHQIFRHLHKYVNLSDEWSSSDLILSVLLRSIEMCIDFPFFLYLHMLLIISRFAFSSSTIFIFDSFLLFHYVGLLSYDGKRKEANWGKNMKISNILNLFICFAELWEVKFKMKKIEKVYKVKIWFQVMSTSYRFSLSLIFFPLNFLHFICWLLKKRQQFIFIFLGLMFAVWNVIFY